MISDTTRLHKTRCQEATFLKILKISSKLGLCSTTCARIQNLKLTQLESTWKIILMNVKNFSFGYDLSIGNVAKRKYLLLLLEDLLILQFGAPAESASHHVRVWATMIRAPD